MKTSDDSETGFFSEVDLNLPENLKHEKRNFPFCPEHKFSPQDSFSDYMNEMKTNIYARKS